MLTEWNPAVRALPVGESVCDRIDVQVARDPGAPAVSCEEVVLTYGALDKRAEYLAQQIRKVGATSNSRIAVMLPRSPEVIVAILATFKSACPYVFIEPETPPKRVQAIFEEAGCSVFVTDGDRPELSFFKGPRLDVGGSLLSGAAQVKVVPSVFNEPLAYVVFTSGSSGRPKGVAVSHAALLNYVEGVTENLELTEGATFANVSTFAADLGNTQIFASLCLGGTFKDHSADRNSGCRSSDKPVRLGSRRCA